MVRAGLAYVRRVPDLWIPLVDDGDRRDARLQLPGRAPAAREADVPRRRHDVHDAVLDHQHRFAHRRAVDRAAQGASPSATSSWRAPRSGVDDARCSSSRRTSRGRSRSAWSWAGRASRSSPRRRRSCRSRPRPRCADACSRSRRSSSSAAPRSAARSSASSARSGGRAPASRSVRFACLVRGRVRHRRGAPRAPRCDARPGRRRRQEHDVAGRLTPGVRLATRAQPPSGGQDPRRGVRDLRGGT